MVSDQPGTQRYRQHANIVVRKVAGEYLLIPLKQGMVDAQRVFTLNAVGQRVWERLQVGDTVSDVASTLTQEFDVDPERALNDVRELVALLVARDLLVALSS